MARNVIVASVGKGGVQAACRHLLGAHLDRATVLFFRNAVHDRLRAGFRIASGSAGARSIWIDYLQVHGAHTTLRRRPDLYSGDDHHADTRHSDLDRAGASDVSAL